MQEKEKSYIIGPKLSVSKWLSLLQLVHSKKS